MLPRWTAVLFVLALAACGGSDDQDRNLGGTVEGLRAGNSVKIKNNNTGDILTLSDNGSFEFPTFVAGGASYTVVVVDQPPGQNCTVSNGNGTMNSSANDVNNIRVTCS